MADLRNSEDSPQVMESLSPQLAAVRDPRVSSNHSFTERDWEFRHTVDVGIGTVYGDVKLAGKGREHRHHHRHHHRHSSDGKDDVDHGRNSSDTHRASSKPVNKSTRRRSRTRSTTEADMPVTPPSERVIRILGKEASAENIGLTPKPIFSEMEELLWENGDSVWRETARWVKFEEDVEESGNRFSKPHVGTLSLHTLFEVRSLLLNGALVFDVDGSTLDQISSSVVDRMICTGNLPLKFRDKVKETILKGHRHVFEGSKKKDDERRRDEDRRNESIRSKSEPSGLMKLPFIRSLGSKASFLDIHDSDDYMLGKGNIHFMKKIPPGAEACNILVGEADFLTNPITAFIRLTSAHELGDLTEVPVPTRFIFLLLGTVGNLSRYHEVGRAMGTLMSDEVFHEIAYKAAKREHIIAGIDEFLDAVDEEEEERKIREDSGLVRSGKLFGGLINDIKRKRPFYLSDYKDGLSTQCIASWLFLYFACLTPIVTFGGLLGTATDQRLGAIESLVSGVICGVIYGVFSGQPLTILGSTGPMMVFEVILYDFCKTQHWDFLSFRLWTGIWVGVILLILVATDCSAFVCYITRFTEENFAALIAFIFMYEAIDKILKIYLKYPVGPPLEGMNCFCKAPSNTTLQSLNVSRSSLSISNCTRYGGSLSAGCSYQPDRPAFRIKFSVVTAIAAVTLLDYFMKVQTPKLVVPQKFAPTWSGRTWLVPIMGGNAWWTIIAAIIPAVLATILTFMDQQITAVIVNRRENKLKKGGGYHLDLFVLAFITIICSFLGIPFFVAATVRSMNHVNSLKVESETAAPGEKPQFLGVQEQRATQLLISITIGLSVFLVPVLTIVPMPVLYGVFLYMGASGLNGLQFVDRVSIILMPLKYQPDLSYLRNVPIKRVHIFTGIQLLLDRYFTTEELRSLDDILPEFKRKERDEAEEDCCSKDGDENEEIKKTSLSQDGQANLKIPMMSGNIMKISVPVDEPINISEEMKRCDAWKTVNSSNELAEKANHKRHSKKTSRSTSSHKKSLRNRQLSEIEEEERFLKASIDKGDNSVDRSNNDYDDDDDEAHEFITIKIDKADSVNTPLIQETSLEEDDAPQISGAVET
eukprot:gene4975-5624_t